MICDPSFKFRKVRSYLEGKTYSASVLTRHVCSDKCISLVIHLIAATGQ
jgi:hypothetical protein